ncbi:uncharacterized protein LOC125189951 [Salvia hispanica]|uniref:uncharacterized protein LOC125189951 n=1 Tax=Salvia hispanica TaxID=49212 RepID=UPI002009CDC9|nr:uncharacterized protein LOC125189951 [Salvia hispanica]
MTLEVETGAIVEEPAAAEDDPKMLFPFPPASVDMMMARSSNKWATTTVSSSSILMEAKATHPLQQIAGNPTHKLLLKQWLKEEDLIFNRLSLKETQIDATRNQITHLYCLFFLFHSTSLLLLFSTRPPALCTRSWLPSLCSLLFSLAFIWAIRYKTDEESHLEKMLRREKEDSKLLGKCVEELKRKGLEFDLLTQVDALRRAKTLRLDSKALRKWSPRDFVTMFFVTLSCGVMLLNRLILCT